MTNLFMTLFIQFYLLVVSFENVRKIYIRFDFRSFHLSESNGHQSTFYIRKICQSYSIIMLWQVYKCMLVDIAHNILITADTYVCTYEWKQMYKPLKFCVRFAAKILCTYVAINSNVH